MIRTIIYTSERKPYKQWRLTKKDGKIPKFFYSYYERDEQNLEKWNQKTQKEISPEQYSQKYADFRELQRFGQGKIEKKENLNSTEKWSKRVQLQKGELTKHGWKKENKASTRQRALILSVKEDGYSTTISRCNFVINTSKDRETVRKMKSDRNFLMKARAKALKTHRGILAKGTKGRITSRRVSR